MKMRFILLFCGIFIFSLAACPFAQEKVSSEKPAAASKPGDVKPEAAKPNQSPKGKVHVLKYRAGGIVEALDKAKGKIIIKQNRVDGQRTFNLIVDKKANQSLADIQVGSLINVWVSGKKIIALQKVLQRN